QARTPIDTSLHLSKIRGVGVAQLEYSRIIGMLTYLMTSTRPDLAYAVSRLSRYTSNPGNAHWKAITRDSRSTSGYVFTLRGAAISWKSSKQTLIAKSMMESEFIALDKCRKEAESLRQFVEDIPRWPKPVTAISMHCDSQSEIGRAQSTMYNGKSRHIRRRHNSIRQLLLTGVISYDYVASKDKITDPFTKGLSRDLVSKSSKGIKHEAIDKFVLYKTKVENQLGKIIKVVRSDIGGEYVSSFIELCAKHRIRHMFTAPYSPQQNGIFERKNQTLKEMVTAILISSGMSQDMCRGRGEAILTATYLLNKIPRKEREETPYELWMRRKPSYQYLRVWDCLAKELVDLPPDCKPLGYKWIFKKKMKVDGTIDKYKASNDKMIKSTKDMLKLKFDMKDMGLADVILGIKIIRTQNGLALSQAHYVDKILNTHNAGDSSPARTPIDTSMHLSKNRDVGVAQLEYSRIIGMLIYLMTSARPDLAYAISRLSRYTSNLGNAHWNAITRMDFHQFHRSETLDHLRNFSGPIVKFDCRTALDVVPWETDGESVLKESC
nr:zinc finger, CCHC-type [Tanacetum cinerariifolium]